MPLTKKYWIMLMLTKHNYIVVQHEDGQSVFHLMANSIRVISSWCMFRCLNANLCFCVIVGEHL